MELPFDPEIPLLGLYTENPETPIQKNEMLRNIWDNFRHSNILIIEVPEGEKEQQEIENLFEKIMKKIGP